MKVNQNNPTDFRNIKRGMVFLNSSVNEYIVVTKYHRTQVWYEGKNMRGIMFNDNFLAANPPVDPEDLTEEEFFEMSNFVDGDDLLVGYIYNKEEDEEEEVV